MVLVFYLGDVNSRFSSRKTDLVHLTLSWRRPLSYRNQSIDLQSKWVDWFLYDNGLRHERFKEGVGLSKSVIPRQKSLLESYLRFCLINSSWKREKMSKTCFILPGFTIDSCGLANFDPSTVIRSFWNAQITKVETNKIFKCSS